MHYFFINRDIKEADFSEIWYSKLQQTSSQSLFVTTLYQEITQERRPATISVLSVESESLLRSKLSLRYSYVVNVLAKMPNFKANTLLRCGDVIYVLDLENMTTTSYTKNSVANTDAMTDSERSTFLENERINRERKERNAQIDKQFRDRYRAYDND